MRLPLRSLGTLLLAVAVATCSDTPNAVVKTAPEGKAGIGRFSISPRFSPQAAAVYAQRATFAAANFDHVRIVIKRPPNEIVIDTVITFNPASPPTTLDLFVDVKTSGEIFDGAIQYTNNGAVVYEASGKIQSYPPDQVAPAPQELVIVYVGPGATATRVAVTPPTTSIVAPGSATFTATVFDANNAAVLNVPITWSVSDASIATLGAREGSSTSISTTGKRGSVTVTAATPTLNASATVTVSLAPSAITLVSGGGQTGKAGAGLGSPGVVRVTASDGAGVAGVAVQFAAPSGGSVGSASATTDAQGQASSSLTLGGAVGAQSFAASAAGFSVSIPATATPGDPSLIAVVSGTGQTDTVSRPLKAPFVVKVSDRFGNGVGGVTVSWAKTSGSGTLSGATSVSGADGTASIGYTLGATAGQETVTASAAGVANPVTFTATAITGPANIVAVSGAGQTGRVGQPLGAPFIVKVTDAAGNAVSGAVVLWSATNGTVSGGGSTDAQGQASASFTLGTAVGGATATASVNTSGGVRSATFNATVQSGTVARAVFKTGPSAVGVGAIMIPSVQIELQDAGGNRTSAVNAVSIAIGTNPGQATLGGTLTRNAVAGVATFDDLTLNATGTGFTLVASSAGVPAVTSGTFNVTGTATSPRILFVDQQTFTPITTPPASVTMTAGVSPTNPPAIRVLDPQGAPIANAAVSYTVTRGAQTLFSGTPQTNAQGIITFATLAISPNNLQVAGNYSFVATLQGATGSPLTLPVTVVPAAASKYLVTASTTTPAASATSTVTAQLADQFNNAIATANNTVSWTLSGSGGGSLSGANSLTNAQGQATIVYTAAAQPSGATITVTAIDVGSPSLTGAVTLTPQTTPTGPATTLRILTQPSTLAVSLQPLAQQPSVQLIDANGNAVATPTPVQIVALWPTGSERNNSVFTNTAGIATFTSLAVVGNGTGPISFSGNALTPVSSTNVTSVVAPTAVAFLVQPSTTVQNGAITPAVQVRVVDANNNTVTTSTQRITLAIASNPGNGVLSGTISLNAVNGIVTFPGINIDGPGNGYTLQALATGLTTGTSSAFNITAAPNALAIVSYPTNGAINDVPFSPTVSVRLMRSGNPLSLAGVTVTATDVFSMGSRPPASNRVARAGVRAGATRLASMAAPPNVLSNRTAVTDANGVATFTGMKLTGSQQYFRLAFDASGPGFTLTDTTQSDIYLDAGAATSMIVISGDAQSGATGQPLSIDPTIALVDISGNFARTPVTTVTFATTTGSVNPASIATDQSGFASTRWTMPGTVGAATMTATATINGTPVTLTFTATSANAPPATVTLLSPAIASTPVGTPLAGASYPKARFLDQGGAPVPNYLITVTAQGACTVAGSSSAVIATDNAGELGLTSSNLSFTAATPSSCSIYMVPTGPASAFGRFSLIAAPSGASTFTGVSSNLWNDAANWLPSGVPASGADVFMPTQAQASAFLQTNVTVHNLTVETLPGATVTLTTNVLLTVTGNVDGGTNGIFASVGNNAAVVMSATGAATLSGFLAAPVRYGPNSASCTGSYTIVGTVQTFSTILNCPVTLGANAVYNVAGSFTVQNQGRLVMNQPTSALITSSDVFFSGATTQAGFLTEGSITVGGNLNLNNSGTTTPFQMGPNATLNMGFFGTRFINVGANITLPISLGNFAVGPSNNVTVNNGATFAVAGTFVNQGTLTINSGSGFSVGGAALFAPSTSTSILGSLALNGSSLFSSGANVGGAGSLSVQSAANCTKQASATVNVTGTTPAFTASPAQCSNQIP